MTLAGYNLQDNVYIYSNNKCMCVFLISPVPIAEPLTSELIDTPVFYNLAPRPIKYRVSVPIPTPGAGLNTPSLRHRIWFERHRTVYAVWYIHHTLLLNDFRRLGEQHTRYMDHLGYFYGALYVILALNTIHLHSLKEHIFFQIPPFKTRFQEKSQSQS